MIISTVILVFCNTEIVKDKNSYAITFNVNEVSDIKNHRNVSQQWNTDTTKTVIPLTELTALLKRNAIKPLNYPEMISNLDTKDIKNGRKIDSGTVFYSSVNGRDFNFASSDNLFVDNETGSTWNFVGECIEGKLKGEKLNPVVYSLDFAFAYLAFNPDAKFFTNK